MHCTQKNSLLQAALEYAALGYLVFPCVPRKKRSLIMRWGERASSDPDQIEQWWSKWPNANIGLPTEGLLVVDLDPGSENWAGLEELEAHEGPIQSTPRGGSHYFFQDEEKEFGITSKKLHEAVDTRGTGGCVVLAPSLGTDGETYYAWRKGLVPWEELPPVPEWLAEELAECKSTVAAGGTDGEPHPKWHEGRRNSRLFSMASTMRRNGLNREGILGGICALNDRLCDPPLGENEVARIADSAAGYDRGELIYPRINGQPIHETFAASGPDSPANGMGHEEINYGPVTAAELARRQYQIDWLVDDLLAEGQPAILSGPKKSLKTSIALDLAISLASRTPFLGQFQVPKPRRVAFMSGESGMPVLQETLVRICRAKGVKTDDLVHLLVSEQLPKIGDVLHWSAMENFIQEHKLELCVIDPVYLAMPDCDVANLFQVGQRLQVLSNLTAQTSCGFVLLHHARKRIGDERYVMPELDHIAWAGFQEWARQWILLNRREAYEPGTGTHRLWLSYGGSAGHIGAWGLDIQEGTRTRTTSRSWQLQVRPVGEIREEQADEQELIKEEKQSRRIEEDAVKIFDVLGKYPDGRTKNRLKDECGLSSPRVTAAIGFALEEEWIVPTTIPAKNRKTPYDGYKRPPDLVNTDSPLGAIGTVGIDHSDWCPD